MHCLHIFYELFRHISTLTQQFNIVHKVSHSFLGRPIAPPPFPPGNGRCRDSRLTGNFCQRESIFFNQLVRYFFPHLRNAPLSPARPRFVRVKTFTFVRLLDWPSGFFIPEMGVIFVPANNTCSERRWEKLPRSHRSSTILRSLYF